MEAMELSDSDDVEPLAKVEAVLKTKNGKGWDEWEVLEFEVTERLAYPYHGTVDIIAPSRGASFKDLLGKSCALLLSRGLSRKRFFKGIVYRVEQSMNPENACARISFAAALWALQHGKDSRIFENATAPKIIEDVVKEALEPFDRRIRLNLTRAYATREICTQYQESDWNFIRRLMADEGFFFYFEQGDKESDTETVVLVDSNDSCPWIETMEPVKVLRTPSPVVPDSSWVEVQVVWDKSGEPVANLPIVLESPGGDGSMRSTGQDGRIRLDPVDPGGCEARSSFAGLKYSECVEIAGTGEKSPSTDATDGQAPRDRPQAIVQVARRKVRSGDTLESIAQDAGLKWQDLAFFNWGTKAPAEIDEHLFADVGCTKRTADGKNYIFSDGDSPGVLLVPVPWRESGLASGRRNVLRVCPLRSTGVLHVRLHVDQDAAAEQEHHLSATDDSHEQSLAAADGAKTEDGTGAADIAFAGCPAHLSYSLDTTGADSASACFREVPFQEASDSGEADSQCEPEAGEGDSGDAHRNAEPPEAA